MHDVVQNDTSGAVRSLAIGGWRSTRVRAAGGSTRRRPRAILVACVVVGAALIGVVVNSLRTNTLTPAGSGGDPRSVALHSSPPSSDASAAGGMPRTGALRLAQRDLRAQRRPRRLPAPQLRAGPGERRSGGPDAAEGEHDHDARDDNLE